MRKFQTSKERKTITKRKETLERIKSFYIIAAAAITGGGVIAVLVAAIIKLIILI